MGETRCAQRKMAVYIEQMQVWNCATIAHREKKNRCFGFRMGEKVSQKWGDCGVTILGLAVSFQDGKDPPAT